MNSPFHILRPLVKRVPIVLSCPHSGTEIPEEIAAQMDPGVVQSLADTDWYVSELYKFAPKLGITLVHARYSRYVIDLNRDPSGRALYKDGRAETSLVPLRTFAGQQIYAAAPPGSSEIKRRLDLYYAPYHAQIGRLLSELRQEAEHVLLVDAHSIRRQVSSIRPEPFADVILGDQRGKTAAGALTEVALTELRRHADLQVAHNEPFMGGYLTRRFGQPEAHMHALQLEMAQDIYMDEATASRDAAKEERIVAVLRELLRGLLLTLKRLS